MQKIRIFLNSKASQGQSRDWQSLIHRQLFRSNLDFIAPSNTDQLREEIKRATDDQVDVIISVGGDGTFHTLIQNLAEQKTRFLVLPAGTANDLARELGSHGRVQEALDYVRRDAWKLIDLITVNGAHMASNGGIGVISDVAGSINNWRQSLPGFKQLMTSVGHPMYSLILGLKVLTRQHRNYHLRLSSPDFCGDVHTPLLMVNNQPSIAGSFQIAPHTRNDDGRFNVTVHTHQDLCQLLASFYRTRQHIPPENDPKILSFETDRLSIEVLDEDSSLAFYGDGEPLASGRQLEIGIKPRSLRVYTDHLPSFENFYRPFMAEAAL
ncbi:MAG: diacylglycerol kinase family protein [Proteobacteria bacterium]|nr:diacylglycerol kinase family protein [Pseudomonadota bacterium]